MLRKRNRQLKSFLIALFCWKIHVLASLYLVPVFFCPTEGAFILALFSGQQGNSSSGGRCSTAPRCEQEYVTRVVVGAGQPLLRVLLALVVGDAQGVCDCYGDWPCTSRILFGGVS